MSTELIDLRTLPEGTLCEATGPLRTILGPVGDCLTKECAFGSSRPTMGQRTIRAAFDGATRYLRRHG